MTNEVLDGRLTLNRITGNLSLNVGFASMQLGIDPNRDPTTKSDKSHLVRRSARSAPDSMGWTLEGKSDIILSSLRDPSYESAGAVSLFATIRTESGSRVAVCLFGSQENVCDNETDVPSWRKFGWTSSHDIGMEVLLNVGHAEDEGMPFDKIWDRGCDKEKSWKICHHAANICVGQGEYLDNGLAPYERGYTLGQYENVNWLANIYHSAHAVKVPGAEQFDEVYVGSAYWVRSSNGSSWKPYTRDHVQQLRGKHEMIRESTSRNESSPAFVRYLRNLFSGK